MAVFWRTSAAGGRCGQGAHHLLVQVGGPRAFENVDAQRLAHADHGAGGVLQQRFPEEAQLGDARPRIPVVRQPGHGHHGQRHGHADQALAASTPAAAGAFSTGGGGTSEAGGYGRKAKFGKIGALRQQDADLVVVARFQIILRQFLADLGGGGADHGILVGIVFRIALEDFDSDGALFHAVGVVLQVGLHHEAQEGLAALAGPEMPASQQPDELIANGRIVQGRSRRGRWSPGYGRS